MTQENKQVLSDEQAAAVGRELRRHLAAGATIRCPGPVCLDPQPDGAIFTGLVIEYPAEHSAIQPAGAGEPVVPETLYLVHAGGDAYQAEIVPESKLDDAYLLTQWASLEDIDPEQRADALAALHDDDEWTHEECTGHGKRVKFSISFEDGWVEVVRLPQFAHRALAGDAELSMKRSEWRALSPEAQEKLERITGAIHPETRLARARAAEAMRNVVLGSAPAGDELTAAGIAMAAGCKAGPLMRAIKEAGEGDVTMNQRLSKDQALQAIAAITKPAGDATQGDAASPEAFDAGALARVREFVMGRKGIQQKFGGQTHTYVMREDVIDAIDAALASRAGQEDKGGV